VSTSIEGGLSGLIRETVPVVLFFFIAFLLIFLLFKLLLWQYHIEFAAFTKAAIAALILGKVILLLDWAESGRGADKTHRRIIVVALKTFVYAVSVVVLGIGERIFEAYRKAGTLGEAVSSLIANVKVDRFMGLVLLISLVVFVYLMMQEIEGAMGKGALLKLFFEPPQVSSRPRSGVRRSKVSTLPAAPTATK
jgi:hypothetical protein